MMGYIFDILILTIAATLTHTSMASTLVEPEMENVAIEEPITEYEVVATVYNAFDPSQGWGDGSVTASGKKIDSTLLRQGKIKYIAISRDLREKFSFGDKVYVDIPNKSSMSGVYHVEDLMAKRWTNRIDILTYDMKLGKWNATIRKYETADK